MGILQISKQINALYTKNPMIKTTQNGFLLIELMIALIVLIFFMHLMFCYQTMSIVTGYEAIKRFEMINGVNSFLARASLDPTLFDQMNYCYKDCTLTWKHSDIPIENKILLKNMPSSIHSLSLKVTWLGWNKKQNSMLITTAKGI